MENFVDLGEAFPDIQNLTDSFDSSGDFVESGTITSSLAAETVSIYITETALEDDEVQFATFIYSTAENYASETTLLDEFGDPVMDTVSIAGGTLDVPQTDDPQLDVNDDGSIVVYLTSNLPNQDVAITEYPGVDSNGENFGGNTSVSIGAEPAGQIAITYAPGGISGDTLEIVSVSASLLEINTEIESAGIAQVSSDTNVSGVDLDFTFLGDSGFLVISSFSNFIGTVRGFNSTDAIDLGDVGSATGVSLGANNVLTIKEPAGSVALDLDSAQDFSADSFLLQPDGNGGTEVVAGASSQNLAIGGTADVLLVVDPGSLTGTIYEFDPDDIIDLAGIGTVTGATIGTNDVLTLYNDGDTVATLKLDPTEVYSGYGLLAAPDGNGGTDVTAEPDNQNIAFTGTNEILVIVNPGSLTNTISNFKPGDTLDLSSVGVVTPPILYAGSRLVGKSTSNLNNYTLELASNQNYVIQAISVSSDGSGGFYISPGSSSPPALGENALFAGAGQLWITDGTAGGTQQLTPTANEQGLVRPFNLISLGDEVVFEGNDESGNIQLWVTDGTKSGTQKLTTIQSEYGGLNPINFTFFGSDLLFSGWLNTAGSANDSELWVTDGTVAGTKPLTSVTNASSNGLNPYDFTAVGDKEFFYGDDANGATQIWITDGSTDGTVQLSTYRGGIGTPDAPLVFGDGVLVLSGSAVFISDGTAASTQELAPSDGDSYYGAYDLGVLGDKAIFAAPGLNYVSQNGASLWVTDGTDAGTHEIIPTSTIVNGAPQWHLNPNTIAILGSVALFSGNDENGRPQLWVTDGTAAGTQQLTSIVIPGSYSTYVGLNPGNFFIFNGKALFDGYDANGISQLWVTDGTAAGTQELTSDAASSLASENFTAFGEKVLFQAVNSSGNTELWVTDGTDGGTQELTSVADNGYNGLIPSNVTVVGDKAFFAGLDGNGKTQLWVTDGTQAGTQQLTNVVIGADPSDITPIGTDVLFAGVDENDESQLWITDGTTGGTEELSTLGPMGLAPSNITDIAMACYAEGTLIATQSGEISVERLLQGGNFVKTFGAPTPIKWIGHRHINCRRHPTPESVWPIRIAPHAFAENAPHSPLYLSPEHAVFTDGVLIPIRHLINGVTIAQEPRDEVTYYHIELPRHDVILAEGLPCESWLDTGNRSTFENAAITDLHPSFAATAAQAWAHDACAPLVEAGPLLEAVRTRLNARAGLPTDPTAHQSGPLHGWIDGATSQLIHGWAWQPEHPGHSARLEILAGETLLGEVLADEPRPDVRDAGRLEILRDGIVTGHDDGRCGFTFRLPTPLSPFTPHTIRVRRAADGAELWNSGQITLQPAAHLNPAALAGFATALRAAAATGTAAERAALTRFIAHQADHLLTLTETATPDPRPLALFIDETLPAPEQNAAAQAALDHMRSLQTLGYRVAFATSDPTEGDPTPLHTLGITTPAVPSVEDALRRLGSQTALVYLHRIATAARYTELVRHHCPNARLVYSVADLHFLRIARQAAHTGSAALAAESRRLRARELHAASLADRVITHSPAEAALLRAHAPGARVHVVPWSVPLRPTARPFQDRNGIAFIGGYRHAPNVDAAHWLINTIMPLVRQQDPSIECLLVGSHLPDDLSRITHGGIVPIGHAPDLAAIFDRVRLTVAPLRYGAGLKGKLLHSLAAGVPCIATPVAAEGLPLPPALRGCIGTTPAELAALILQLHTDAAQNTAAAEAGLQMIREGFSTDQVDRHMRDAVGHAPMPAMQAARFHPAAPGHPAAAVA